MTRGNRTGRDKIDFARLDRVVKARSAPKTISAADRAPVVPGMSAETLTALRASAGSIVKKYPGLDFDDAFQGAVLTYLEQPADTDEKLKRTRCHFALVEAGVLTSYSSMAEYQACKAEALRLAGLCTRCKTPADGEMYCETCKIRAKERIAKLHAKRRSSSDDQAT